MVADIIKENANKRFETRTAIPGHVQQGFTPTANDRVMAVRFSLKAFEFIEGWNKCYTKEDSKLSAEDIGEHAHVVIGIHGDVVEFTDVEHLYKNEANISLRKGNTIHWNDMIEVSNILSGKLLLEKKVDSKC